MRRAKIYTQNKVNATMEGREKDKWKINTAKFLIVASEWKDRVTSEMTKWRIFMYLTLTRIKWIHATIFFSESVIQAANVWRIPFGSLLTMEVCMNVIVNKLNHQNEHKVLWIYFLNFLFNTGKSFSRVEYLIWVLMNAHVSCEMAIKVPIFHFFFIFIQIKW